MLRLPKKTGTTGTTNDPVPDRYGGSRILPPTSGGFNGRVPEMEGGPGYRVDGVACDNPECEKEFHVGETVIRLRYGEGATRNWGLQFTAFPDDPSYPPEQWFHLQCFVNTANEWGKPSQDECCFCNHPFERKTEENGTLIEITQGKFSIRPGEPVEFTENGVGSIHWACGLEFTSLPIPMDTDEVLE